MKNIELYEDYSYKHDKRMAKYDDQKDAIKKMLNAYVLQIGDKTEEELIKGIDGWVYNNISKFIKEPRDPKLDGMPTF
jgi:hypothetical protein